MWHSHVPLSLQAKCSGPFPRKVLLTDTARNQWELTSMDGKIPEPPELVSFVSGGSHSPRPSVSSECRN